MREQMSGLPRDDGTVAPGSPIAAPVFFVSFILSGTMIFLNLLVEVIVNSMSEMPVTARPDEASGPERSPPPSLHAPELGSPHERLLAERLGRIETLLEAMRDEPRGRA